MLFCFQEAAMKEAVSVEHVTVYRKPGRYGGWPANYGMWSWDDEIVLMFQREVLRTIPI